MGQNNNTRKRSNKKTKKHKKLKIFLWVLLFIILLIGGVGGGYLLSQLGKIQNTKISQSNEDLGIDQSTIDNINKAGDDVINVALFGVDRRNKGENGNSDAIMVASIDMTNKKIKLSSLMRDSYVHVDGLGMTKLNAAYSYGGPQLAIKTINQNFKLNIKDYFTVDFFSLEKIIDALGGVQINVKPAEVEYINESVVEVAKINNQTPKLVTHSGLQTLTGRQAVSYARIRHVGNNDFERTDRQRTVLNLLFQKIQNGGLANYTKTVNTILPYTETSMSNMDIISLGTKVLTSGTHSLDQERFPVDGYWSDYVYNGIDYLKIDLNATSDQLFNFIYKDIKPTPKK
ncbi:LCP family protein [Candidatus Clostridium radicumherbarum]|uniref:LCP family protein n=1 Tax=Candidatus Clostridium radicumherbarum TaxID=3381662 RepID=A0ABW8TWK9_9CLOT